MLPLAPKPKKSTGCLPGKCRQQSISHLRTVYSDSSRRLRIRIFPESLHLGYLHLLHYCKIIRYGQQPISQRPARIKAYFSNAYNKLGLEKESNEILDELYIQKNNGKEYIAYSIAMIESERKNYDKVVDWLEEAYREEDSSFSFITLDSQFKNLRDNERYKNLLRQIGYQQI